MAKKKKSVFLQKLSTNGMMLSPSHTISLSRRNSLRHLRYVCLAVSLMVIGTGWAQRVTLSRQHGFCTTSFPLSIAVEDAEGSDSWAVRYTLDSSTPTASSPEFVEPLIINGNTIVRAAAFAGELRMTDITTATYLFVDDILNQGNTPEGYPSKWGKYTQISGTAIADYGMDTVMTKNTTLAPIIREGLQSLPVLSIVTDQENLFSHENNEETGGIYIFTGPPVGDATGHGWTRPASIELIGGEQAHDLSTLSVSSSRKSTDPRHLNTPFSALKSPQSSTSSCYAATSAIPGSTGANRTARKLNIPVTYGPASCSARWAVPVLMHYMSISSSTACTGVSTT